MKTCLLVIDAQESFRHRPYFDPRGFGVYVQVQNALIAGCLARDIPIVRILHVDGPADASNPFALASGHVRPLPELLPFEPAAQFQKHRHSALVGTGLDVWLVEHGIRRLIVSGIRTEQCCETTTRHASDLGYTVDFVLDATLSFDMQLPSGAPLRVQDIKDRTAAVLKDRFARICSVEDALDEEHAGALATA
ncbi:MAG: isochorismatase family protein [Burkholderiaceae bacterium]|nr:isochorismatase family protein [Rhodoferax sp.]MCB2008901.1 isochorismatase family protein [Rhodoferax sp.]MCB2043699.1 isochorismatase family protein [Rhodoferax sp.]MCP5261188.1 isochorismatase family protein [Rhodoferax sp.]MCW5628228.1 isochorismatase family protein [Rhodoferax sp.]